MNKITKVTRKWILLDLLGVKYIDIEDVILTFFNAEKLPSLDSRYENMAWDFYQHRKNNLDWEDDWFIYDDRLNFYWISDERFLEFVCFVIHPENLSDIDTVKGIINIFNNKLIRDWYEIKASWKKISWLDVFKWYELFWGNSKVNFYTEFPDWYKKFNDIDGKKYFPSYEWVKTFPCIVLIYNNWDDFWRRTSFDCEFYENEFTKIDLWIIKILDKDSKKYVEDYWHIIIPEKFNTLSWNFCSIFTSSETYKIFDTSALNQYKKTILNSLNEVTFNKSILAKFKKVSWFETSLLRDSESYSMVQNIEETLISFWFKNDNGDIFFDFEKSNLPFRINTLIWKNGSWKTTLLANITNELVKYNPLDSLLTRRPSFLKIIQVSYSVFDIFTIPSKEDEFKYIYCWLRNEDNQIDMESLHKRLSISLDNIQKKWKSSIFTYLLRDLLDQSDIEFDNIPENFIKYSSWQKILITILSEIISNIEENSLILFDEPETHLHPNMIFKLIKVMYSLLDDNNSYLIIATHSPIVLQQIPSKNVQILDNFWNRSLNIESFWENFSEITKEVFSNYEEEDVIYKEIFKKLVDKDFSEDEIIEMFNNWLSLNSRIYLKTLFNIKNKWEK